MSSIIAAFIVTISTLSLPSLFVWSGMTFVLVMLTKATTMGGIVSLMILSALIMFTIFCILFTFIGKRRI
jgi:hypothetical protein